MTVDHPGTWALPGDPTSQRAQTVLADPRIAQVAREVRQPGAGLLPTEVGRIPMVTAEAVHERVMRKGSAELYQPLRPLAMQPGHKTMYMGMQKLRWELGPVARRSTVSGTVRAAGCGRCPE